MQHDLPSMIIEASCKYNKQITPQQRTTKRLWDALQNVNKRTITSIYGKEFNKKNWSL